MSERTFRYRVEIDTSDVARATAEVRTAFAKSMNKVAIGGPVASPTAVKSGGMLGGDPIKAIMGFSIAGYGMTQLGQLGMQLGQLGAANLRTGESFKALAANVNIASDSLINKLGAATQGTVTDYRLMANTSLLLVTAQSQQIDVTERQIEVLGKFARMRSQQLGIGTEEAYARLISGISRRESELLDELGLSTKGIATALGVPVETINRSTEALLQGIVKLAEQELSVNPEPLIDDAAKMEQASKQMADAWDKLAIAAAKPVSFVLTWTAQGVQGATDWAEGMGNAWDWMKNPASASIGQVAGDVRGRMGQMREGAVTGTVTDAQVEAYARLRESVERYESALAAVAQAEESSQSRIFSGTQDMGERNVALAALHKTMIDVSNAYARMAQLEQAGVVDPGALGQVEGQWQAIVDGIGDGTLELEDANSKLVEMLGLLGQIAPMIGPAVAGAAGAAATIHPFAQVAMTQFAEQSRMRQVVAGDVPIGEMTEAEKKYRLAIGDTTEQIAINEEALGRLATGSDEAYEVMIKIAGLKNLLVSQQEQDAQEIRDKRNAIVQARLGLNLAQADTGGQVALLEEYRQTLAEGSAEDLGCAGAHCRSAKPDD
jgi:hypothetical protein